MRCCFWVGLVSLVFALGSVDGAAGQTCYKTLRLSCPVGSSPDTVYIVVYVKNCNETVDAFGFDILYRWDRLRFTRAETTNTLTANWIEADGALFPGTIDRVRVGGYDVAGIAPRTSEGTLIRLYFEVLSWVSLDTSIWFDDWSLTDDVAGFFLYECEGGNIPVEGRTWGGVKALYE